MRVPLWVLATLALVPALALAQTTREEAKAEGKAFAGEIAGQARQAATTAPDASRIPNYQPSPVESSYADDPDTIAARAASAAPSHTGYRTMRDSMERRARFEARDIEAVIARSELISDDPLSFTSGMSITGSQGSCVPLPAGTSSPGRYYATCNTGYTAQQEPRSCPVTLDVSVTPRTIYGYYCVPGIGDPSNPFDCAHYPAPQCSFKTSYPIDFCDPVIGCVSFDLDEYVCAEPVAGATPIYTATEDVVTATRDESQCAALAADSLCQVETETCSDSDPVTRIVDGVAVTQPCWAWERSYACTTFAEAQDCSTLENTTGCRLAREDCLTDEPCKTWERVYDCPLPDAPTSDSQFICDGDVYCIDGSCETIERTPNDEFKDAVVALNAMNQARREFDPATLRLFEGTRNTCSSKVFGVLNCCKGKGFPLIPGISLLVALGCSSSEILLHERDAQGLCAYVGTYCSNKVLGVCVTKKKVYCCFESKLSRILQEQGRQQLGKPWDKPKLEQCEGFTIDEFARLDLSRMDFSEVYAEFTEAARLPDELEAAAEIQQKIEDYYARSGQ
jgi:conjugal transfer mating pair stabilization protein TraN